MELNCTSHQFLDKGCGDAVGLFHHQVDEVVGNRHGSGIEVDQFAVQQAFLTWSARVLTMPYYPTASVVLGSGVVVGNCEMAGVIH